MSELNIPNPYPVELSPPDISAYAAGNTGIPYVWSWQAEIPGPHLMVSAVVHGNELCGAIALDWCLRRELRPQVGKLTLAFMNVAAYQSFDTSNPNASRWVEEDFNRVWADDVLGGTRDSVELRRAREVQPLVASVDRLLDIHSMQKPSPPMMMAGALARGRELAAQVAVPQLVVSDHGHAAGKRMRDHGHFATANANAAALLIECGQHWQPDSAELAIESTARFLVGLGCCDESLLQDVKLSDPTPQHFYEVTDPVTIETDEFRFAEEFNGGEVLVEQGTLLGWDGGREVCTPYPNCLLVMPSKRLWRGQTAVRLARRIA